MINVKFFCLLGKIFVSTFLRDDGRIIKFVGITIIIIIVFRRFCKQPVFIYCTKCSIIWVFTLWNWTTKSFWFKTYNLWQYWLFFSAVILLKFHTIYLKMSRLKHKSQKLQMVTIVINNVEIAMDQVLPILPKCHHNSFLYWCIVFNILTVILMFVSFLIRICNLEYYFNHIFS